MSLTSDKSVPERARDVGFWYAHGGILIIGYDVLRGLVAGWSEKQKSSSRNNADIKVVEDAKGWLLDGPALVIADEAHKLKNQDSIISQTAGRLSTKCRIALTGSPLANNLEDYYALIDWVSPGYLGDPASFREDYQTPIEDGMYADSTAYAQRKSLTRLQALKDEIDPKVNRKGIAAIANDLPSKIEFVITVDLTDTQRQAYGAIIESVDNWVRSGDSEKAATSFLNFINLLTLLVFHPALLKLTSAPNGVISQAVVEQTHQSLRSIAGPEYLSTSLSAKTAIIADILRVSKRIGDKVLIFSHCLDVLSYLETWLQKGGQYTSCRLTGATKTSLRSEMANIFNAGKLDVFLISTKAGGLGLNVTGANRIILADFEFNPTWEEQAVGRSYRMGQQKAVKVYHLCSGGTFEETLHHRSIFKRQLALKAVDKQNVKATASKIKDFLFMPRENPREDLEPYRGRDEVMDELLTPSIGGRMICGIRTTDMLQYGNEQLTAEEMVEVKQLKETLRAKTASGRS